VLLTQQPYLYPSALHLPRVQVLLELLYHVCTPQQQQSRLSTLSLVHLGHLVLSLLRQYQALPLQ
jgi:hypothetical protein